MDLFNDPLWTPLSVDLSNDLRAQITKQSRIIDEQRTIIRCRDETIRRLKAKEANSGREVLQYLQQLESKFDAVVGKSRPASGTFEQLSDIAQRRVEVLEKRLALRDDAIQLINAMLVDTISSKDSEIEALSNDLEVAKDILNSLPRRKESTRSECSDSVSV